MNSDRMTSDELATYLRCGIGKARKLMGGEIPGLYDGRKWTVSLSDVQAWEQANKKVQKHRRPKGQRGRGKSLGSPPNKRGAA